MPLEANRFRSETMCGQLLACFSFNVRSSWVNMYVAEVCGAAMYALSLLVPILITGAVWTWVCLVPAAPDYGHLGYGSLLAPRFAAATAVTLGSWAVYIAALGL